MPSYRVTMAIGVLAPGVRPDAVLPAAKSATLELAVVEAADLQIVSGKARIVVRVTADDSEVAAQIGRHVASRTNAAASVTSWRVTERLGGRWEPI